jgi:polysaccharide biosynthesis protein PslH
MTNSPALGTGRDMRSYACVRALAMLGPVDLAFVHHDFDEPGIEYQEMDNLELHEITPSRGFRRAMLYARKRLQLTPSFCCRGTSPELVAACERLALRPDRGRVIVSDGNSATALMPMARERPIIYSAHNFESDYVSGAPRYRPIARAAMRRYERRLIGCAAESWMVSRHDVESARRLVPGAQVRYVPNVVDVAAIRAAVARQGRAGVRGARLLMVGDFTYTPNKVGRDLLVDAVLPLLWQTMPEAELTLVGRGMGDWQAPDPRVHIPGYVEDLADVYAAADCVVVPITEGAGSPLKFIEALAYGVPVVATPLAARGLEVVAGVHYQEGEDALTLAAAIVEVFRDEREDTTAEGVRLAEREYSIESLAERLAA